MRFWAILMAVAVLLPLVPAGMILACTLRGKGFAVRGEIGERLEWVGTRASRGTQRLQEMILGPGEVPREEGRPTPIAPEERDERGAAPQAVAPRGQGRPEPAPDEREGDPPPR
jgi:hypothetical protein